MKLYDHQLEVVNKATPILKEHKLIYLVMEVRTGKTITALTIADNIGAKSVAFITKKKAIPSIEKDFSLSKLTYKLIVTNYEQVHNITDTIDLFILDEAHGMGQYPKPSQRTKKLKEIINGAHCILLSGTPTPESYSQIYHQLDVTGNSPFNYPNFYKWAQDYVSVKQKMIGGFRINDYSRADQEKILSVCGNLLISCTQQNAGFTSDVQEHFVQTTSNDVAKFLYKSLEKDQVAQWGSVTFVADTPANMLNKFSQIAGGTLIQSDLEASKNITVAHIFDDSKAVYIRDHYAGKRIAIYYRYKAELTLLQSFFHNHTQDWTSFESGSHPVFLCQIQSGREGISLRSADCIIMYNIDFSATSYWQVRARMQFKDRTTAANVVWLFSDLGIEEKVYKAVSAKKNFTVSYYNKILNVRKQGSSASKKETAGVRVAGGEDNKLLPSWMAGSDGTERRISDFHRSESARQRAITASESQARPVKSSWF